MHAGIVMILVEQSKIISFMGILINSFKKLAQAHWPLWYLDSSFNEYFFLFSTTFASSVLIQLCTIEISDKVRKMPLMFPSDLSGLN